MAKTYWERDAIQFPRLLAEIHAVGLTAQQIAALCESMDLSAADIYELFDRAEAAFQRIKKKIS